MKSPNPSKSIFELASSHRLSQLEHISTRVPLGHSMWIDGLTETGTGK